MTMVRSTPEATELVRLHLPMRFAELHAASGELVCNVAEGTSPDSALSVITAQCKSLEGDLQGTNLLRSEMLVYMNSIAFCLNAVMRLQGSSLAHDPDSIRTLHDRLTRLNLLLARELRHGLGYSGADSRDTKDGSSVPQLARTWADVLHTLLDKGPPRSVDWWLRTVGLVGIVLAVAWLGLKTVSHELTDSVQRLRTSSGIALTQSENGALVFHLEERASTTFLLAPNGTSVRDGGPSPWVDTGIDVNEGDNLTFHVSGQASLGLHHVVQSAILDRPSVLSWTTPNGADWHIEGCTDFAAPSCTDALLQRLGVRRADLYRWNHGSALLLPTANYGEVVAYIGPSLPRITSASEVVALRPHVFRVGRQGRHTARVEGRLFMTVNEIWLTRDQRDTYVVPEEVDREYHEVHFRQTKQTVGETWDGIVARDYWNVWFDDNAGAFSVTLNVEET